MAVVGDSKYDNAFDHARDDPDMITFTLKTLNFRTSCYNSFSTKP